MPAGIFIILFIYASIHFLFPLKKEEKKGIFSKTLQSELKRLGPMSKAERFSLSILSLTLIGWLTTPFHGIKEAWVALAGLLLFLTTGYLDKKNFRNNINWGLILFFGIVNSIGAVSIYLKIDNWFLSLVGPILTRFSLGPLGFLTVVTLMVSIARLFLRKDAVVILFTLSIVPLGKSIGIHPGVVLLTIVMACGCFFLQYQDSPYQIAYSSTNGQAFSHVQARKILVAKFIATLIGLALSVPYWKMLGFIH